MSENQDPREETSLANDNAQSAGEAADAKSVEGAQNAGCTTEEAPAPKPLVAVSFQFEDEIPAFSIRANYLDFLKLAGVSPIILLPQENPADVEAILGRVDGVLIPGGDDIDPMLYGCERAAASDSPVVARDGIEPVIVRYCIEHDLPFLGICRGFQMINVVCGGTLCQDINKLPFDHEEHWRIEDPFDAVHEVVPVEGTPTARIFGTEPFGTNTIHHQTIEDMAPSLTVDALSEDGLIEAVSHPDCSFFVGVQWHPEFAPESPFGAPLAKAFGDACRNRMEKRHRE